MGKIFILILLAIAATLCEAQTQSLQTKIVKIEVAGKEVKKDYKVSFFSNNRWIEADRTSTGFVVPDELKNKEFLSVQIAFGKYNLQFSEIHISKFSQDWTVGVDKEPFSEEFVTPEEAETIKSLYYIQFEVKGLIATQVVVKERKSDATEQQARKVYSQNEKEISMMSGKSESIAGRYKDKESIRYELQDSVNVSMYVDDKPVEAKKIKMEICVNQLRITSVLNNDEFSTNQLSWLDDNEKNINLKISFKKYVLEFLNLSKDRFQGHWKIFVNNPPFSPSADIPNPEMVDYVYAIEFYSGNGNGTVLSKIKYKSQSLTENGNSENRAGSNLKKP